MKSPLPASKSPLATPKGNFETMNFSKAVHRLLEDKKLTNVDWGREDLFMFIGEDDGNIKLSDAGKVTDLILHKNDFTSENWYVIDEV